LYFTTEFLLRRPLGALITAAERANVPKILYDFFTFGPDHTAGIVPTAFSRMTERDGAWMTRILARFTPEMVEALAGAGQLADPSHTAYLASVLQGRLDKILQVVSDAPVAPDERAHGRERSAVRP
jgi:hypothetical protein